MGIPGNVLAGQLGGLIAAPPISGARTIVFTTTVTGPAVLLGPPATGFTRRCVVLPTSEGGITVMNPLGGSAVQFDLLIGTTIFDRRTTNLNGDSFPFGAAAPYLSAGESLFVTYTSGLSDLHWVISYVDYPVSELVKFDVPLNVGDTLLVPPPAAGKSHVLDAIGEDSAGFTVYNPGANTPAIYTKINGNQVSPTTQTFAPGVNDRLTVNPGVAIDLVNATTIHATADAADARAHGAYWITDL